MASPLALLARQRAQLRELGLERHHYTVLALLGAASFFDGYDSAIKVQALTQIRESFGLSQSGAAWMLAVIYIGALPAAFITRAADRIGRRRMLMWSVVGYTIFSGLSALAPDAATFALLQFCQQVFLVAEGALVWTMAAEELPAKARGFGFGVLGMQVSLGFGAAAILYGVAFEGLEDGWRWLYALGVPPLVLVSVLRRKLPESRRFEAARTGGRLVSHWQEILHPPHRRWILLALPAAFLLSFSTEAGAFVVDFLQEDRGIDASTANLMVPAAGVAGLPIMVMAGSLSDRYGRRLVGGVFALSGLVGGFGFFWLGGGIPVLLPCMAVMTIGIMGSFPIMSTFITELFPTALRGSASSWWQTAGIIGRTASLAIGAVLLSFTNQSWTATILGVGTLSGIILVVAFFPDTHGRELEETSGELEAIPVPEEEPVPLGTTVPIH